MKRAIRAVLESIYDPEFLDTSHFRPGRGCHSALIRIRREWGTSRWFLEFGISKCFHTIDRHRLISILKEEIDGGAGLSNNCSRLFFRLIHKLFSAGRLSLNNSGGERELLISPRHSADVMRSTDVARPPGRLRKKTTLRYSGDYNMIGTRSTLGPRPTKGGRGESARNYPLGTRPKGRGEHSIDRSRALVPHSVLLSALLGNIYLHKLDQEIERIQQKHEIPIVQIIKLVLLEKGRKENSGEEGSELSFRSMHSADFRSSGFARSLFELRSRSFMHSTITFRHSIDFRRSRELFISPRHSTVRERTRPKDSTNGLDRLIVIDSTKGNSPLGTINTKGLDQRASRESARSTLGDRGTRPTLGNYYLCARSTLGNYPLGTRPPRPTTFRYSGNYNMIGTRPTEGHLCARNYPLGRGGRGDIIILDRRKEVEGPKNNNSLDRRKEVEGPKNNNSLDRKGEGEEEFKYPRAIVGRFYSLVLSAPHLSIYLRRGDQKPFVSPPSSGGPLAFFNKPSSLCAFQLLFREGWGSLSLTALRSLSNKKMNIGCCRRRGLLIELGGEAVLVIGLERRLARKHGLSPVHFEGLYLIRICYARYADDFLLGIAGTVELIRGIQKRITHFLQSGLNLEVGSAGFTTIAARSTVEFLGTVIREVPKRADLTKTNYCYWRELEKRRRAKHRIHLTASHLRSAIHSKLEDLGRSIPIQQLCRRSKQLTRPLIVIASTDRERRDERRSRLSLAPTIILPGRSRKGHLCALGTRSTKGLDQRPRPIGPRPIGRGARHKRSLSFMRSTITFRRGRGRGNYNMIGTRSTKGRGDRGQSLFGTRPIGRGPRSTAGDRGQSLFGTGPRPIGRGPRSTEGDRGESARNYPLGRGNYLYLPMGRSPSRSAVSDSELTAGQESSKTQIKAPVRKILQRLRDRGLISRRRAWPTHVACLTNVSDEDIVNWFAGVAISLLSHYRCCDNLYQVRTIVDYQIRWSAIFTLAHKHRSSARKIILKYSKDLHIVNGGKTLAEFPNSIELRKLGPLQSKDLNYLDTEHAYKTFYQVYIRYV
nr:maturase-related protein [Sciadopitys verticillata]